MKGIEQWMWIAAGIIAGLVTFVFAYQQIVSISKSAAEQRSIEQFNEIKNIVDNLCWSSSENKREYRVNLADTIEGIYVVSSKYEEYNGSELSNKILSEEDNNGKYLCVKVKDKNAECKELECDTSMPFIGTVPEESSLSALVDKFSGKAKTFDYYLMFEKVGKTVKITTQNKCGIPTTDFNPLVKCNGKNIVVLMNNLLVIGDSTSFVECCDVISKPFENLLINSASYFGGSKILIIWEDPQGDPNATEKARMINGVKMGGFDIESIQHNSTISYDDLKNYGQVWLIRPGICENSKMSQYCDYKWNDSEFDALKSYLSKGKIVLITDYPDLVPRGVGDRIVKLVNQNVTLSNGCFCGCKGESVKADKITEHEITSGIDNLIIRAAVSVDIECNK